MLTSKAILVAVLQLYSQDHSYVDEEQAYCMALNVYHESRGQSVEGQIAVANATMARVRDGRFPRNVCDVVYEKNKKGCSFSWTCDSKRDNVVLIRNNELDRAEINAFTSSVVVSLMAMTGEVQDFCGGATYYYNPRVASPNWANYYTKKCVVEDHTFYKREMGSAK